MRLPVRLRTREGWDVVLVRCPGCLALVLLADEPEHRRRVHPERDTVET